ncbi:MAG: FecR domain-containing protein, partial [Rhodospirillaceae bacterium]|nr:FecR domain-containing protein [Rhodospirillaceae bacterium]
AGALSPADRSALMRWLAADPARLEELEAMEAIGRMAGHIAGSATARDLLAADWRAHHAARPRPLSRFALPLAGAALAAGVAAFLFFPPGASGPPRVKDHTGAVETGIGQIANYVLSDQSQITVAANSAVSVDFSSGRRDVSLTRGEAFFDVQHDQARPFVIAVGGRSVTVTGTRFNVNNYADQNELEVAVVEGRVNVSYRTDNGASEVQRMTAGDVILFPASGALVRRNLTPEQAAAWRSRKLYFDSARLDQVIAEVNRYSAKPLVSESRDIEKLSITGQFPAGDVALVLTSLQQIYGIRARETANAWLLDRGR